MSKSIHLLIALAATLIAARQGSITTYSLVPIATLWIVALSQVFTRFTRWVGGVLNYPAPVWMLILAVYSGIFLIWIVNFQPAVGKSLSLEELLWLIGTSYSVLAFIATLFQFREERSPVGFWAGPLLTATTLLIIIFSIELGLRYLWVRSDNFQFSKMHQNWARVYWEPQINALGYRDNEPHNSQDTKNVIILGDSLASGYGVNDIADTFPHLLGQALGDGYHVNIVAQPGWGISTELAYLEQYPVIPNILIASHYINDIAEGPAGQRYHQQFPRIRIDPPESQHWWIENFYIGNFLYYRLFLYVENDSVGLYNNWIRGAYENPEVWSAYQDELQALVDRADRYDAQLIVLVWPNLLDPAGWRDVTDPVVEFFGSRDVAVVDMADLLANQETEKLTVNRFDAHPSVFSHQQAANALIDIVKTLPKPK